MTPCEKLGYVVGDRFEVVSVDGDTDPIFYIGSIIQLIKDDGTEEPKFKLVDGEKSSYMISNEFDDHYFGISEISPITKEWNGEGLPPVGTVCEFVSSVGGRVSKGTIVCHVRPRDGASIAVIQYPEGGWDYTNEERKFRPIAKPKTEAELMEEIFNKGGIQGLIDAGYRKP